MDMELVLLSPVFRARETPKRSGRQSARLHSVCETRPDVDGVWWERTARRPAEPQSVHAVLPRARYVGVWRPHRDSRLHAARPRRAAGVASSTGLPKRRSTGADDARPARSPGRDVGRLQTPTYLARGSTACT